MKKRILSRFCVLVLLAGALPSASALQGEAARAADTLATLGLIDTAVSGDYGLNEPASRAQAGTSLKVLYLDSLRSYTAWASLRASSCTCSLVMSVQSSPLIMAG